MEGRRKWRSQLGREQMCSSSVFLLLLFRLSKGLDHTHPCWGSSSLLETPSQARPETTSYQLSGYHFPQSGWHIKLAITASYCFVLLSLLFSTSTLRCCSFILPPCIVEEIIFPDQAAKPTKRQVNKLRDLNVLLDKFHDQFQTS